MKGPGNDGSADGFVVEVADGPPPDWSALVARDPHAEYSHTRHWTEAVCRTTANAEAVWLTVRQDDRLVAGLNAVRVRSSKKIMGLEITRSHCNSSFEGTSGGPVMADDLDPDRQEQVFRRLVGALAAQRKGWLGSCSLVLNPVREERFGPVMREMPGWDRQDAPTAQISLAGGEQEVEMNRLNMAKRNERNRGLRRGVEWSVTTDKNLLAEYYLIYEQAARHWGVAAPPLALLEDLLDDPHGGVFFTCVRLEGKVIGGHVNLHHGAKVLVWNGVTDPAYANKYFPATVCFWGDLVESCRRQAAWLDLGGSGQRDTLLGFKKYLGAEMRMRGLYLFDSPTLSAARRTRRFLSELKVPRKSTRWHDTVAVDREGEGR